MRGFFVAHCFKKCRIVFRILGTTMYVFHQTTHIHKDLTVVNLELRSTYLGGSQYTNNAYHLPNFLPDLPIRLVHVRTFLFISPKSKSEFSIKMAIHITTLILCLVPDLRPSHRRNPGWVVKSLIDNVLSVSGTDYHDIGA